MLSTQSGGEGGVTNSLPPTTLPQRKDYGGPAQSPKMVLPPQQGGERDRADAEKDRNSQIAVQGALALPRLHFHQHPVGKGSVMQ